MSQPIFPQIVKSASHQHQQRPQPAPLSVMIMLPCRSSTTTILGPAAAVSVLSKEGNTQVTTGAPCRWLPSCHLVTTATSALITGTVQPLVGSPSVGWTYLSVITCRHQHLSRQQLTLHRTDSAACYSSQARCYSQRVNQPQQVKQLVYARQKGGK